MAITYDKLATTASVLNAAPYPSDDADYKLLAANDLRQDIEKVPGSGPIRGLTVYNDVLYAFRDNAAATAGDMYKATTAGWVKISFNNELLFNATAADIKVGDTVVGGTSGATAVVLEVLLRTGTWTVAGAGSLVLGAITNGPFQTGEDLKVSTVKKGTANGINHAITRLPGGWLELAIDNFTGSTETDKIFGADGVNPAFSFNGTTYVPIHTGMTTDTPEHVYVHKFMLFLSFYGSIQFSAIGDPYAWTVVLGAGEVAVGDQVECFIAGPGDSVSGSSLQILTRDKLYSLYGSSADDFRMITSISGIGFYARTAQLISNNSYGLSDRGIQAIVTTLTYGNFDYASVSHLIQSYVNARRGMSTCSTTSKLLNQYRLYFTDGSGLVVGLTGDKDNGIMPLDYGMPVRCITTSNLSDGAEVTFFGSDDGFVYQDNVGTSFDGNAIEAWVRPAFNNVKSPQIRKTFKRAVFEVATEGYAEVQCTYDLGYGTPAVSQSTDQGALTLAGAGGYWDQFTWDEFTWDSPAYLTPSISVNGTEKNFSFLFYSNRAQDASHTVTGCSLSYIFRRPERTYS